MLQFLARQLFRLINVAATIGPAAIFSMDFLSFFCYFLYFGPFLALYGSVLASFRPQIDPPNFIWTESHQISTISVDFMTFSIFGHRPRRYLLQPLSIRSAGYVLVGLAWWQVQVLPSIFPTNDTACVVFLYAHFVFVSFDHSPVRVHYDCNKHMLP